MFSHDKIEVMHFGQKYLRNEVMSFSLHHKLGSLMVMYLIAGDVNHDLLVNMVSARICYVNLLCFPFQLNNID